MSNLALSQPFLSNIARPDEIKNLKTIIPNGAMEKKIEQFDSCKELLNAPPLDASEDTPITCIRTLNEEEIQDNPEMLEAIKRKQNEYNEKLKQNPEYFDNQSMQFLPAPQPTCTPGKWSYARKDACGVAPLRATIFIIVDGVPEAIGGFNILVTHEITLNHQLTGFTEDFDMVFSDGWGEWLGATFNAGVECLGVCRVVSSDLPWAWPVVIPGWQSGRINYDTTPTSIHRFVSTYRIFVGPNPTADAEYTTPVIRCDYGAARRGNAGCIFPNAAAYMIQMQAATIPDIRNNIRNIQQAGPLHYGRPNDGNALRHTKDQALKAANRAAACPPPHGNPAPSGYNCDEYPFASTYQGASQVSYPNWGSEWVPKSQNSSQGGFICGFNWQNRMLDGDYFWVDVSTYASQIYTTCAEDEGDGDS